MSFIHFCVWLFSLSNGRRQWQPTPVLLPGKSHGRRSLVGCSPWGCEGLDTTERLHFHFSLAFIGEGNGNPLQCSCLENPRDSGAWWAAIYGVAQSRTWLKWLSSSIFTQHSNLRFILFLLLIVYSHCMDIFLNWIIRSTFFLLAFKPWGFGGLPCILQDLSYSTRNWTWAMAVKEQSPNHWMPGDSLAFICLLIWMHQVLIVGSSFLTRDWTWAPCIGSMESVTGPPGKSLPSL